MPAIDGFHHVTLTVSDLAASASWYERVLGLTRVAERLGETWERILLRSSAGLVLGLTKHRDAETGDRFSETRVGLDHVSFACSDRGAVETWAERLDELGVPNGGVADAPYGHVLTFRDPDNIQLEFFAPVPG